MLVFVSWLLFFAPPNGNLREFGPSPQELRRSGLSFVTSRYAGGWNFSVITLCTDTARPFME